MGEPTVEQLKNEVYRSLIDAKERQLLWALGQLNDANRQLDEMRALLTVARRLLMEWDNADSESEQWAVRDASRALLRSKLTPFLTPVAPTPRFKVGDPVWAFNGEPRLVTGMSWAQAMRRNDQPIDHEPPWCWFLDTVDPDDPACKGCGPESAYRPRVQKGEMQ